MIPAERPAPGSAGRVGYRLGAATVGAGSMDALGFSPSAGATGDDRQYRPPRPGPGPGPSRRRGPALGRWPRFRVGGRAGGGDAASGLRQASGAPWRRRAPGRRILPPRGACPGLASHRPVGRRPAALRPDPPGRGRHGRPKRGGAAGQPPRRHHRSLHSTRLHRDRGDSPADPSPRFAAKQMFAFLAYGIGAVTGASDLARLGRSFLPLAAALLALVLHWRILEDAQVDAARAALYPSPPDQP